MMTMRSGFYSLLLVFAGTLCVLPIVHASDSNVPGTYELFVCNGSCSPVGDSSVRAKGVLVLMPEAIDPASLSVLKLMQFRPATISSEIPNGCFVLTPFDKTRPFIGLHDRGTIEWSHFRQVSFALDHSPDSAYWTELSTTENGLSGFGAWRGGFPPDEPQEIPDGILARRLGRADVDRCMREVGGETRK